MKRPVSGAAGSSSRADLITGLRAVLTALGVIGVLFLAYDVVERRWLSGITMARLHALNEIRGLLAAGIAATVASWLIMRAPPLFPVVDAPRRARTVPAPTASERQQRFAEWFIVMRWIAVVVAVVLVIVSDQVMNYLAPSLLEPLLVVVAVLAVMNLAYVGALRLRVPVHALLLVQAYGDLLVLTVLLHLSGGIENPLGILMLFHVLIAGIVLSRRQCYLVAAGASVLFAAMAWGEYSGMLPHYMLTLFPHAVEGGKHLHAALDGQYVVSRVGLQVVVLFLTGFFTSTVTAELQRREHKLEELADEALEKSQLLERSLDSTGTALCVRGPDLQPSWWNPRWGEFFEVAGGADAPDDLRARGTLKDGSVNVGEMVLNAGAPDGVPGRTVLLTTAPLLDKAGSITHVVELARDVTELRRIQQRVGRAEQLAAVGELAGKVAHEVNNPIAVISAKTRLLLSRNREEMSEHVAGDLVKITDLADKVAHIARGLLSYARPSHGPAAPVDIGVIVGRAVAMVETAAVRARVHVVQAVPPGLPLVRVNAVEMEQVFVNLLVNALDAMPRGGQLTVRAFLEEPAGTRSGEDGRADPVAAAEPAPGHGQPLQLSVVVEDTGVGIPRHLQGQVFEPFVTTKPEGKGTGLGLAICLGLVRSQGGTIDLESEPGQGTRVYVRLPVEDSPITEEPVRA